MRYDKSNKKQCQECGKYLQGKQTKKQKVKIDGRGWQELFLCKECFNDLKRR